VNDGNVQAICCLKPKTSAIVQLSPPQIYDLIAICDVAAKALRRLNETSAESGDKTAKGNLHEAAAIDTVVPRSLSSVFSKVMGTVAHDLRTPLTVIRGFIKMILDGRTGPVPEAQRKCLDVAFESVNRLVDFSATVGGTAVFLEQFHVETFELREIWSSVLEMIQSQLDEQSISVNEFISPGMLVAGDRGLLFEVIEKSILSMVSSVRGGGDLRVEISRRSSGDVSLQISLAEVTECASPVSVVTQLQSVVLLHGGRLSFVLKPESGAVLNLIFPGYVA
jgi:signal transduction histidine kinase